MAQLDSYRCSCRRLILCSGACVLDLCFAAMTGPLQLVATVPDWAIRAELVRVSCHD
jgi:hypothetical protein